MVWELLSGIFHVGNVGVHLLGEYGDKKKAERLRAIREEEYKTWLDPELEKKTRAYVSDYRNHDEVWDALEDYFKKNRASIKARYEARKWFNIWEHFVDGKRKNIAPNSGNENLATACMMDMQGKQPEYLAKVHRSEPLW